MAENVANVVTAFVILIKIVLLDIFAIKAPDSSVLAPQKLTTTHAQKAFPVHHSLHNLNIVIKIIAETESWANLVALPTNVKKDCFVSEQNQVLSVSKIVPKQKNVHLADDVTNMAKLIWFVSVHKKIAPQTALVKYIFKDNSVSAKALQTTIINVSTL